MSTAWMVYFLGVGTLFAIGAGLLESALRHFGHSVRFVHAAALASMMVLAVVAPRREAGDSTMLPVVVSTAPTALVARESTPVDRLRAARTAVGDAMSAVAEAVRRYLPPTPTRVALGVWAAMSFALLVLFVSVNRRLSLRRRSWESRSMDGTPVRVTPDVGPAVIGFLHAEIVFPQWLFERPVEEQRLILAHEREHLRARDHLLLGGAWFVAIAVPWHPAVWYLLSRIRLAIELDCDVRVLRGGTSPRRYGALLIDMATRRSAAQIGALALVDAPSHLERRIRAMHWRRRRLDVPRGLVLGAAGGLLVLIACEAKVPTAAEVASMDVGTLEKKAGHLDGVSGKLAKADYFVNGAPVTADSARAIAAAKIGSVGVMKARSAAGRDTIQITTVDRIPKSGDSANGYPANPIARALGSDAVLMIDGVEQPHASKLRVDPARISSIQIMKAGRDRKYPNGLVAIETKGYQPSAASVAERKPIITRTDSVIVSSARGLASASQLWSGAAAGPDRVVLMPRDSSASYKFGVADLERASSTTTFDTAHARARGVTIDLTKPYAIEIDGKRATKAELDQLRATGVNLTYTMYPHDMSAESFDPAAKNGLLRATTNRPAKH